MHWLIVTLLATGAWPMASAWRANRRTTLQQASLWAASAWLAWLLVFLTAALFGVASPLGRHVALALTGCAGVAVLGARRPGVGAWNFVVCGLLVTLMLPAVQGWGEPRLETPYLLFLAVTIGFGLLNYLPTRGGLAAALVGVGCGLELAVQATPALRVGGWQETIAGFCLAAAPWVAWLAWRDGAEGVREFDRVWLDFRDRFGVVWGQRVREQFNRAAVNAGWPLALQWQGLVTTIEGAPTDEVVATEALRALLRRFGSEEGSGEPGA